MNILVIKEKILSLDRATKKRVAALNDFILVLLSFSIVLSLAIYTEIVVISNIEKVMMFIWRPILLIVFFNFLGVYKSILRYINFSIIYILVKTFIFVLLVDFIASFFLKDLLSDLIPSLTLIHTILYFESWVIAWLISLILIITSRVLANIYLADQLDKTRVVIYGAGSAGIQLSRALSVSSELNPVGFIDKDKSLQETFVGGLRVISPNKLEAFIEKEKVDEVLVAIPSLKKSSLGNILKQVEELQVKVRILPGVDELAKGKVSVSELKAVEVEDLLGRNEVSADTNLIAKNIREKVVLVTGAGGSIGAEISRQALQYKPTNLILYDVNEFSLYKIKEELLSQNPDLKIKCILGDVRNKSRLHGVCKTFGVQTIYHSAAYKHVPLVEENPFEAVLNNIFGTLYCLEVAIELQVETFVLISTDKAVRPTNVMGATKRFSELILQSLAADKSKTRETKICMVRFGNVLGSSGSAIPLFQKQIKEGGPLTVTHPEVTRYFMSIPEAAELVLQAGSMSTGGDVFLLDMGEPVKILDLAKRLISFSGMEVKSESNPEGDIEIIFTGLRPGEKLFEELLIGEEAIQTEHKQIYKAEEEFINWEELERYIDLLRNAEINNDHSQLMDVLEKTITGYNPSKENVDLIYKENEPSDL